MFEKVPSSPDLVAGEHEVLKFWSDTAAFDRLREKNRGRPRWSFLDGPITANNPMGVHHAWGRTLKDAYQRYFAMNGREQRYQNGFDCQGLWVEVEVEKELGIRSKRDIEALVPGDVFASIDKFVTECKARVDRFARRQTEQSIRLGYWMDWDRDEDWRRPPDQRRSYFTMAEENNYTIWSFLKKCHQRGLVYRAYDSMPWCPRCAVGISQMEMHEGYVMVAHRAVFVRLPLRGRPGENLLIWTTTPWTLTSNVAAAVNPALTYLKVEHRGQFYYLAKGALTANRLEEDFKRGNWVEGVPKLKPIAQVFKEKGGYEIVDELKGAEMVGWTYDGPFDELPAQSHAFGYPEEIAAVVRDQKWATGTSGRDAHRVIAWDLVGETEGTGIVHIAPGCGKEDFELGKKERVPPIAPLNEEGCFVTGFGPFEGRSAVDHATADFVIENLTAKGLLFAVERYPHNYPHCWRCKTELLFRLVDEWYISMSWREEIMRVCHDIRWIPDFGLDRELDWLRNMGDWMISKKRYWGLALPIWVCDRCGAFDVIGARDELSSRAVAGWDKLDGRPPHRPWIDLVKIACPVASTTGCTGVASRISDVGNPWLDAGIVPFSTMRYNSDREYWQQWFPADFITECFPGQFRNWFYALLAMSTMMEGRAPFRTLLGHALVRDEHGEEMHKSKGNAIWFDDAAEKMGADVMRWLYCRQNPTQNLNFGYTPGREVERQVFNTLWNCYAFFVNYARLDEFDSSAPLVPVAERPEIDRWVLSNLQLLIQTCRQSFEAFSAATSVRAAELFIEDLSNWYIRRNRRRFWRSRGEDDRDKLAAYQTLYEVLATLCRLLAPVIPFLTERMHRNLTSNQPQSTSVHHGDYPEPNLAMLDAALSQRMSLAKDVVTCGHSLREKAAQRVRQPLAELRVAAADSTQYSVFSTQSDQRAALEQLGPIITDELNVKRLAVVEDLNDLTSVSAKPNFATLGPRYGKDVPKIAAALAKARADVLRKLQRGEGVSLEADGRTFDIGPGDVTIQVATAPGWVVAECAGLHVALNTTINPELLREGLARDMVRHIQQLRKDTGLNIEDRIEVTYQTNDPELGQAITEWRDYIMAETLCVKLEPGNDPAGKEVDLGGRKLWLELRKAA